MVIFSAQQVPVILQTIHSKNIHKPNMMTLSNGNIFRVTGGCFTNVSRAPQNILAKKTQHQKSHLWWEFQSEKLYVCPKQGFGHTYKVSAWNSHHKYYLCNTQISRNFFGELAKRKWNTPLALWEGNPLVTDGQRPVTRSFDVFFDLRLNKRLSTQPRRRWLHRANYDVTVMISVVNNIHFSWRFLLRTFMLTWTNLNLSMNKKSHAQKSVGCNAIPKLQRL